MKFLKRIVILALTLLVLLESYLLLADPLKIHKAFSQEEVELSPRDVLPRPLSPPLSREPTLGEEAWYFQNSPFRDFGGRFDAGVVDKTYFPYYEDGEIHPPKKYDVENNYSERDIEKIYAALKVAHRYADINKALKDGYRIEDMEGFANGMGTHVANIRYILDDEVSVEKPEFLAYVKNRGTGRFQLVQVGFILQRDMPYAPYRFFDAKEARGHSHIGSFCLLEDGVYMRYPFMHANQGYDSGVSYGTEDSAREISEEDCQSRGGEVGGPGIWMMHFAVNMYNEFGMFADYFPYVDYLSANAVSHSFFGEKL